MGGEAEVGAIQPGYPRQRLGEGRCGVVRGSLAPRPPILRSVNIDLFRASMRTTRLSEHWSSYSRSQGHGSDNSPLLGQKIARAFEKRPRIQTIKLYRDLLAKPVRQRRSWRP